MTNAEQGVSRARAEWTYANNNLHRIEPLLVKQFVTVDQVDRARTSEIAQAQALKQAESQLRLAQAGLQSTLAQEERSRAMLEQSKAQHEQAQNAVTTLEPLINQRGARASAVETARYNLNNCRVYAPFEARVTNLTISEGAYAHIGQQVFTLIDARTWWAVANFREGQLQHIIPGMRAEVYVLSKPNVRFHGRGGEHRLWRDPRCGRGWPPGNGAAGCAENPELGAPGHAVPGSRARGKPSSGPVSSERIGGGRDSRDIEVAYPRPEHPTEPGHSTWLWEFLKEELAPYPGRAATVARMVLAATCVMIVCNTFRIPYAFVGGIYALLISRESPRATLQSAGTVLLLAATGVAYILVSVQFVISVPLLHFLWIIGTLFLAFYALTVVTNYGAFVAFALVICIAVTIWDRHVSAETNVEDTLWLSLVALVAVVVTSGVELAFGRMRPGDDIVVPVADRLAAIHSILISYAEGRSVDQAVEEKLIRLGMLGTSSLRQALRRSDYSPQYQAQMSGVVALVGSLVDMATALTQLSFDPAGVDREHLQKFGGGRREHPH